MFGLNLVFGDHLYGNAVERGAEGAELYMKIEIQRVGGARAAV